MKITIVGPVKAGKSGLMLAMASGLDFNDDAHGFPTNHDFKIQPTEKDGKPLPLGIGKRGALMAERRSFVLQHEEPWESTRRGVSIPRNYIYSRTDNATGFSEEQSVEIVDTSGEFCKMTYWSELSILDSDEDGEEKEEEAKGIQEQKEAANVFGQHLNESDAFIMVFPALQKEEHGEIDQLGDFIRHANLESVIVVWTQIDLLLGTFGARAADIAHESAFMEMVIGSVVNSNQKLAQMLDNILSKPEPGKTPPNIYHFGSSSHGFLMRNGFANINFTQDPRSYTLPDASSEAQSIAEKYWRPYMAVDPFLVAVFGKLSNEFCFDHAELRGLEPVSQDHPSPVDDSNNQKSERKGRFWPF